MNMDFQPQIHHVLVEALVMKDIKIEGSTLTYIKVSIPKLPMKKMLLEFIKRVLQLQRRTYKLMVLL